MGKKSVNYGLHPKRVIKQLTRKDKRVGRAACKIKLITTIKNGFKVLASDSETKFVEHGSEFLEIDRRNRWRDYLRRNPAQTIMYPRFNRWMRETLTKMISVFPRSSYSMGAVSVIQVTGVKDGVPLAGDSKSNPDKYYETRSRMHCLSYSKRCRFSERHGELTVKIHWKDLKKVQIIGGLITIVESTPLVPMYPSIRFGQYLVRTGLHGKESLKWTPCIVDINSSVQYHLDFTSLRVLKKATGIDIQTENYLFVPSTTPKDYPNKTVCNSTYWKNALLRVVDNHYIMIDSGLQRAVDNETRELVSDSSFSSQTPQWKWALKQKYTRQDSIDCGNCIPGTDRFIELVSTHRKSRGKVTPITELQGRLLIAYGKKFKLELFVIRMLKAKIVASKGNFISKTTCKLQQKAAMKYERFTKLAWVRKFYESFPMLLNKAMLALMSKRLEQSRN